MGTMRLDLPVFELHGSARAMGRAFGEAARPQVRELYQRRLAAVGRWLEEQDGRRPELDEIMEVAKACVEVTREFDGAGYEEFAGIAEGAGISEPELFVMQGLTDLRDVLEHGGGTSEEEGCSSFVVAGERAAGGKMLVGQTWDLDADNVDYVCLVHRRPDDGSPETWSLTLTGCLTLIGLSSAGIAVGNTNIRTRDVRMGVQYLSVLHRALRAGSFAEAVDAIGGSPRAAAHYFYVADGTHAAGLECSAQECEEMRPCDGVLVHCNHTLTEKITAVAPVVTLPSTYCRQPRLEALIRGANAPIGVEEMKGFLADHANGENAICRHTSATSHVATNACVVMCPEEGTMHACRGQSHVGTWKQVRVRRG